MTKKPSQATLPIGKGMFYKAAKIAKNIITDEEIAEINKYALSPLDPADVFSFKVTMCGNQVDRDHEVFPMKTLEKLSEMFVGKTVVKDHVHKSDNQIARIYKTYLNQDRDLSITPAGEVYTQLIAKCYMIKTKSNSDLIAEINAGIRKEVSLGCRISKAVCSICDTDNAQSYCKHFPGQVYDEEICFFKLEEPKDAYELSFVAIPAQKEAGTVKSYGEAPVYLKDLAKLDKEHAEQEQPVETTCKTEPIEAEKSEQLAEEKDNEPSAEQQLIEHQNAQIEKMQNMIGDLVVKLDAFIETVMQNVKEERTGETADFSDVLDLADKLDELQEKSSVDNQETQEAEPESNQSEAESQQNDSKEADESSVSADTEDLSVPEESVEQPEHFEEQNETDIELQRPQNEDVDQNQSSETEDRQIEEDSVADLAAQADLEKEKLAQARLRGLELSINLMSK